ncbi:PRA1 family protein 2, partial [Lates japonicus]
MASVRPPPLRDTDDFLLCSARFAVPDVRDLDRWNNRIINNLLYYQSNYFLSVLCFLLIVGYFQPFQLFVGAVVVTLLFLGFVWAAENQAPIR